MRTLPLIAALALVSACTSLEDIRDSKPVRSEVFNAGFKDMAACVVYETAPSYTVSSAVFEKRGEAILSYVRDVNASFISSRVPVWEMTISEDGSPGISLVEFRSARDISGGSPWVDDVWPIVKECGNHRPVSAQR